LAWVMLFLVAWLFVLVLVPVREWKRLWPAGIIGLVVVYVIDSTFVGLGAFSFTKIYPGLSGLPIFYILSIVAGSILSAHFYPDKDWKQMLFVMLMALGLLLIEVAMIRLNYFHHLSWSLARSYALNIGGFIVVLWLAQRAGAVGKGPCCNQ